MSDKIIKRVESLPQLMAAKRTDKLIQRVAAYARVSTDKEEQQTSIVAQKEYYTDYITNHAGWQFAGVYADEGTSGCSTKRREQFKRLISDCMAGEVDMVLTKSISRFGRNTIDTLTAIRELKSKGIGVYFEKEQVWTMDSKGEFIITLMSSLAQEESRSMSENILWAVRKRYAQGNGSFAYSRVLGLDKGKEKFEIVVNHEEAIIVCKIFRMCLQGLSPHTIAVALTAAGIPTPGGCEVWSGATVRRMLSNEKYKGDMLLQKEFTVDFLTKKVKKNEGELPQYYVSNNHESIIDPWLYDFIQEKITSRKRENKRRYSGVGFFNSKIVCAKCGATFGPRPWHSTSYNNSVWQCRNRYSAVKCKTTNIYDKLLFYVLNDIARKKAVAKDIRVAIVEFAADVVGTDRLAAIERYMDNFESMSASEMLSDADDLSFVIDRVLVKTDRSIEVLWLDGSVDEYEIPRYTPKGGIEK
ncbi:MAG TPA: recombinase family protein [Ruminococcus flavefaciens]|nr:recombinase family protein [Ruminococcus flavefaciens]